MLAEELERARERSRQSRASWIWIGIVLLLVCAILLYMVTFYELTRRDSEATKEEPVAAASEPEAAAVVAATDDEVAAEDTGDNRQATQQTPPAAADPATAATDAQLPPAPPETAKTQALTSPSAEKAQAVTQPEQAITEPGVPAQWLEQLRVAQIENNPRKEADILRTMQQQGISTPELDTRYQQLVRQLEEERFSTQVIAVEKALQQKDVALAKKRLQPVVAAYGTRSEVKILVSRVQELQRQQDLARARRQAAAAESQDNWQEALRQWQQAEKLQSGDTTITEGIKRAETIIRQKKALAAMIARPYALADSATKTRAQSLLQEVKGSFPLSPSLRSQAAELTQLLAQMNREVPVQIVSDGRASIEVRGVGKVGKTQNKQIQLKPGKYQLVAKCDGFRDEFVQLQVPYKEAPPVRVELACNETL